MKSSSSSSSLCCLWLLLLVLVGFVVVTNYVVVIRWSWSSSSNDSSSNLELYLPTATTGKQQQQQKQQPPRENKKTNNEAAEKKNKDVTTSTIQQQQQQLLLQAKIFQRWPISQKQQLPCYPIIEEKDNDNGLISTEKFLDVTYQDFVLPKRGILFQKVPKCASTTTTGITLRIAKHLAKRVKSKSEYYCDCRFTHGYNGVHKYASRFSRRLKNESFLFTIIREPSSRFLSNYYYRCVTHHGDNIDDNIDKLGHNNKHCKDFESYVKNQDPHYYLNWLSVTDASSTSKSSFETRYGRWKKATPNKVQQGLKNVIKEYNFIGLVERYDESLVVLMLLLRLKMSDILYFSNIKARGSYVVVRQKENTLCRKSITMNTTATTKDNDQITRRYLTNPQFHNRIRSDQLLYDAANRSLDKTIDDLKNTHRIDFDMLLSKFRNAQLRVKRKCNGGGGSKVTMPCNNNRDGVLPLPANRTDCIVRDWGCGFKCLDEVSNELNLRL